jgi:signal peptide peptidase-like protein 2B
MSLNNIFTSLNRKMCRKYELYSILIFIITCLTIISYLITKSWMLNNVLGFSLIFTILSLFHIKSLKICAILLISAFFYDVFWVYFSPNFFHGTNLMVNAATKLDLPIKLEIPYFSNENPLKQCMMLGLGDLVLPGLVLKFCHRFDFLKNTKIYYEASIFLYVAALSLSGIMMSIFGPQPVLFYMCPTLLIGINYIAYKRRELKDIWSAHLLEENLHLYHREEVHRENNQITLQNIERFSDVEKNDISFTESSTDSNSAENENEEI